MKVSKSKKTLSFNISEVLLTGVSLLAISIYLLLLIGCENNSKNITDNNTKSERYSCSSIGCVPDENGTLTESECNNSCLIYYASDIATDNSEGIYIAANDFKGPTIDFLTLKFDNNGNLVWNKTFDKGNNDISASLATDSSNNVYITGSTEEILGIILADQDILTIKYNSSGNLLNLFQYGDNNVWEYGDAITVDFFNNFYIAGTSWDGKHFTTLLLKYNSSGNLICTIKYDSGFDDSTVDTKVDKDGNIYILTNFDADDTIFIDNWIRILKYDSNCNLIWETEFFSSETSEQARGLSIGTSGNIYIISLSHNGENNFLRLLGYNPDGILILNKTFTNYKGLEPIDIVVDHLENILVTGTLFNGLDKDVLIMKIDNSGNEIWSAIFNEGGEEVPAGISLGGADDIYIAGNFFLSGTNFISILKYDANGNSVWTRNYP